MTFSPLAPCRVVGGESWKPSLEVFPLDPHQPSPVRVPERSRFPVVQDEGVPVGPPGRGKGQRPPVDLAAVHGRQVDKRSIPNGHRLASKIAVGDFVSSEGRNRVRPVRESFPYTDDTGRLRNGGVSLPDPGIIEWSEGVSPDPVLECCGIESQ